MDDRVHRLSENLELRDDIGRTHQQIRDERLRDYGSDSEYEVSSPISRRRRKPRKSTVRFADDMNRSLHELHHAVRDLGSDHLNLETSFNREVDRRDGDPVAERVERRLRFIQSDMDMDRAVTGRYEELSNLSMELRSALQQQQAQSQQAAAEERIRASLLASDPHKHRLEADVDDMRRKLDMAEGSKSALQSQVDDLRNQLRQLDTDRSRMKSHMEEARIEEELRERRKRRSMEEDQKRSLERELLELRQQMSRSVGVTSETEELRRNLEKSERQRVQLSDHIETITKDLENREKQTAKLINELRDAERHKNHLLVQVEDTAAKLRDSSRELDKALTELRNTQLALADAEKKRDEFKGRAQETVRQWKMKVKQLERELDRHKHGNQQMMGRNEQLIKEMEAVRQHGHAFGIQLENMRRELGDALAVRAAQDEQIRLKDVEINELKSLRMDLDQDKNRIEDRLSSVEAAHCLAQDQAAQLQQEFKDLSSTKAHIAAELSEANGKIHMELSEDKSSLKISKRNEEKYRKEAEILQQGMNRLEEDNHKLLGRLEHTKKEYESVTQMTESDLSKAKRLEDELFHLNSDLKKMERRYETVSAVKGALNGNLLADLKIKMKWLRNQVREKIKYEEKLRKDIRDALTSNEGDRKFLLQELAKREEVLDELAAAKQELAQREIENLQADHILDLTDELEVRKIRENEQHKQHKIEKHQIITDIEGMRDKERARIEERYLRLQGTMRALQSEIKVANLNHQQVVELERNINNIKKSPGRPRSRTPNNRLRTATSKSPHRRPQTPPSRLPKGHNESIGPMSMSDEDFQRKFLGF
ncbi:CE128-like protein [Mya arenaria]|uniref:CE128-like protein n=1 Tax=Mya arenaria TaxID=6604 RepID=A0ABY7F864_MYAAR|nr:CE128-like protein [Mya arenaria]